MICKECGAFFIRFPCPSCGQTESSLFEDEEIALIKKIRSAVLGQEVEPEDHLVKPSELQGRTVYQKSREQKPEDQSLLKPSQLNPDNLIDPADPFDQEEETLVKPSKLHGGSAVNPKFRIESRQDGALRSNFSIQQAHRPKQRENETDQEYKARVKETLEEVMHLLGKLIE